MEDTRTSAEGQRTGPGSQSQRKSCYVQSDKHHMESGIRGTAKGTWPAPLCRLLSPCLSRGPQHHPESSKRSWSRNIQYYADSGQVLSSLTQDFSKPMGQVGRQRPPLAQGSSRTNFPPALQGYSPSRPLQRRLGMRHGRWQLNLGEAWQAGPRGPAIASWSRHQG